MQPNRLTLAGRNVPVATLRLAALAFAVIAAALWLEWLIRALLGDEAALIERRYRALLLPVRTAHPAPGPVLDVERMADLARMADQLGSPILRRPDGTFDLVDGATTFRYSISTGT